MSDYLKRFYTPSLALMTDLYELTMAYGYWKKGIQDREAAFQLFFRKRPFEGNFALTAGLHTAIEFMEKFHFTEDDIAYLASLKVEKKPLFEQGFLDYLKDLKFSCDVDAVPEGTPIFPYEPILQVKGPILQAQILESALLTLINFQSLIATKACRICYAAEGDEVIEFGLRRAQGVDGALSGARAAFIGGCRSTSNVLAGKYFDIPVKGTHAHSWIMTFDDEIDAFKAYAESLPHLCVYLIDTYHTIEGAKNAIAVAREAKKRGVKMIGVRLDSGDIASLSIEVRKLLDEAGFEDALIMASNELDEYIIRDLKKQGARVDLWGVGTNLITAKQQSALDGVYKLTAVQNAKKEWQYRLKISEQMAKVTNPGLSQIRRFFDGEFYWGDMLYDTEFGFDETTIVIDPLDPTRRRHYPSEFFHQDLLVPIFQRGKCIYKLPSLREIQKRAQIELSRLTPDVRRFLSPTPYFFGLEKSLYDKKIALIDTIEGR